MSENAPLQCKCGVTAFTDIRFTSDGMMSLTCFHCHQTMQVNVPVAMAEQAWTVPHIPECPRCETNAFQGINVTVGGYATFRCGMCGAVQDVRPAPAVPEPEPEKPHTTGYKYGGLL